MLIQIDVFGSCLSRELNQFLRKPLDHELIRINVFGSRLSRELNLNQCFRKPLELSVESESMLLEPLDS